ncbi:hypothetical protein NPIL_703471 [Nephila pilipes]|uniref:Uncharacterized protein n=1 Tax=Nephila pilipes TaxID=299642 RepID=A0A8X6T681_NEPPI|nr:hypothetical protein NPIL_703471 [Nephila pilipes]
MIVQAVLPFLSSSVMSLDRILQLTDGIKDLSGVILLSRTNPQHSDKIDQLQFLVRCAPCLGWLGSPRSGLLKTRFNVGWTRSRYMVPTSWFVCVLLFMHLSFITTRVRCALPFGSALPVHGSHFAGSRSIRRLFPIITVGFPAFPHFTCNTPFGSPFIYFTHIWFAPVTVYPTLPLVPVFLPLSWVTWFTAFAPFIPGSASTWHQHQPGRGTAWVYHAVVYTHFANILGSLVVAARWVQHLPPRFCLHTSPGFYTQVTTFSSHTVLTVAFIPFHLNTLLPPGLPQHPFIAGSHAWFHCHSSSWLVLVRFPGLLLFPWLHPPPLLFLPWVHAIPIYPVRFLVGSAFGSLCLLLLYHFPHFHVPA